MELGAEFLLEANAHFSNLLVNTTLSSVQLPTNVYNKGARRTPPQGANGAAESGESECGCGWPHCRQCAFKCVPVCVHIYSSDED